VEEAHHACSWETIHEDENGNFIPCGKPADHLLFRLRRDHWYCDFHADCHSSEEKLCAELDREEQEYTTQAKLAALN
jgi:hypothetical protein